MSARPDRPAPSSAAPAPARDWRALARAAAARSGSAEPELEPRQLVVFALDGSPYAVPVERVREIVRVRPITPVPRAPREVIGVISLRGEVVQVVDLRRRLSLAPLEPGRASRIVVAYAAEGGVAGVLVDEVLDVMRVAEASVRPASGGESDKVEALFSRGDRFVSLLDLDRVLEIDARA